MKGTLDWQSHEVVNIFDEASLWSAPFGRMMMENIPMGANWTVMDIGFGTGFPLLELSQRFGNTSKIYGIDIWQAAIDRTREKIRVFGIENIEIIAQSAEKIPLPNDTIDLICSNLGINNFEHKEKVISECQRVLKPKGNLCITTNPIGTFSELFDLFLVVFEKMKLKEAQDQFKIYLAHRDSKDSIEADFSRMGFELVNSKFDTTNIRFVNADALLDHGLMRIGFLEYWEKLIPEKKQNEFFTELLKLIQLEIEKKGEFRMTIPMQYMAFKKI